MSEITDTYLLDPNVHRVTVTAQSAKLPGTGTKKATYWYLTEDNLPDNLIDSDHPDSEASGAPTLRIALDSGGVNQIGVDIKDFSPASGGASGGATAKIRLHPGTYEGGIDLPVTLFWITGGSQTQPAAGDTYGSDSVYPDYGGDWDFTQNPAGSAPQMTDSTPNDNDGTSQGSMVAGDQVDLVLGSGLDFAGGTSNQAINIPDDDSLSFNISTGMSVGLWFNIDAQTGFRTLIAKRNNNLTTDVEFSINFNTGTNVFQLAFYDGGYEILSVAFSTHFATGTTYHVVGTYEQSGSDVLLKLYKNGTLIGSSTHTNKTLTANTADVSIGSSKYTASSFDEEVNGTIALPFVLQDILDEDECTALYNNQIDPSSFWSTGAVEDGPFTGSGSGAIAGLIDPKRVPTRKIIERVVLWSPRSYQVCDITGREGLVGPTPSDALSIFQGSHSVPVERSSSFELRVLKPDLMNQLRVMSREGCPVRMIALGHLGTRHHGWLVDSNLITRDTRDPSAGFAGMSFRLNHRYLSAAERQFVNLLELFPWSCTIAQTAAGSGSGSGLGGGSGSGSVATYYLEPVGDDSYVGDKWIASVGETVDAAGRYSGAGASISFSLPIEGAVLKLEGSWIGSISFYEYDGTLIETTSKSSVSSEPEVTVPALTWSVSITVTAADESPCISIPYAGTSQGVRVGLCLDCTDPDAVASGVPPWTTEPEPIGALLLIVTSANTGGTAAGAGEIFDEGGLYIRNSDKSVTKILSDPSNLIYAVDLWEVSRKIVIYYTSGEIWTCDYSGQNLALVYDVGADGTTRSHIAVMRGSEAFKNKCYVKKSVSTFNWVYKELDLVTGVAVDIASGGTQSAAVTNNAASGYIYIFTGSSSLQIVRLTAGVTGQFPGPGFPGNRFSNTVSFYDYSGLFYHPATDLIYAGHWPSSAWTRMIDQAPPNSWTNLGAASGIFYRYDPFRENVWVVSSPSSNLRRFTNIADNTTLIEEGFLHNGSEVLSGGSGYGVAGIRLAVPFVGSELALSWGT